ncbi:hypothetical protein Q8G38_17090 [Halomonas venusta]|uniref:hypothetical protein n=1 Tax=Vreelandella venusta TaxID=44935 RepID=UPI00295E9F29|nr:hypothetical protein [Halomonas venusta]MDW0361032.1 hypothetical protein [Halomonas venusta]
MNKWQELEQQLSGVFASAKIVADGYEVAFYKRLGKGERLVIETYVNGEVRGEWFSTGENGTPKHPEGRFFFPMKRRAWQLKQYKELKKIFGKKEADKMTELRVVGFLPYWGSPRPLISHLKKNFPDLELVTSEVAS